MFFPPPFFVWPIDVKFSGVMDMGKKMNPIDLAYLSEVKRSNLAVCLKLSGVMDMGTKFK